MKRKRTKTDDVEYEAPEVDDYGNIVQKTVLTKYDEEIKGEKMTSFRLGEGGRAILEKDGLGPSVGNKLAKLRKLQTLEMPESQLASEYMTQSEMISFKKTKKKKKKKKMLTADDLQPLENDGEDLYTGSRQARIAAMIAAEQNKEKSVNGDASKSTSRVKSLRELMEEEEDDTKMDVVEPEIPGRENSDNENDSVELQEALNRTRRAKLNQLHQPSSEQISNFIKLNKPPPSVDDKMDDDDDDEDNMFMTLNTTDEFCRTLGDIPTYGLSGNRAEDDTTMLQLSSPKKNEHGEVRGAWEEVDIEDTRVEITDEMTQPILEEEPDASRGVANALKLAVKKGYLEKDNSKKTANAALQHLRAIHYR